MAPRSPAVSVAVRPLDLEGAVRERYASAASRVEPGLCCPSTNDPRLIAAVPAEILEKDYGCGDPTRHVRPGETVLDLGSGSGKACYLLSQVVGPAGKVIGVDVNDEMLSLARRHLEPVAKKVGFANVEFRKGRIQDLRLDLEALERYLRENPVGSISELARLESRTEQLRRTAPLVPDESVDVVVSDCVLNLVPPEDKRQLFAEIHRVLRRGGRAIVSDIVSDEEVPLALQQDPELWSGCVSGAFREDRFLEAFEVAGLYGVSILERSSQAWRTIEGIEFRSLTAVAYKGKEGPCRDRKQAVIYRGPFREVTDDDGHLLRRGARVAVCAKTFEIFSRPPYAGHFELIDRADTEPSTCGQASR